MIYRGPNRARYVRVGAHMVEFAVVVPIFFVFIFALIEVGRGMMVSSLVTNASRAGCRVGTLPGKSNTDVAAAVDELLKAQGITGYKTTIQVGGSGSKNVSSASSQEVVKVTVSVPAANTSWLPSLLFVKGTISGQFSMPHE